MWNTPMKRYLLLFGLIGLCGCFLPLIGGTSITLLRAGTLKAWLTILAFAVPVIVAARSTTAATVLASIACFGYLALKINTRALDLVLYAGIGGKLIGIAVVGGLIATVGAVLETRRVAATR